MAAISFTVISFNEYNELYVGDEIILSITSRVHNRPIRVYVNNVQVATTQASSNTPITVDTGRVFETEGTYKIEVSVTTAGGTTETATLNVNVLLKAPDGVDLTPTIAGESPYGTIQVDNASNADIKIEYEVPANWYGEINTVYCAVSRADTGRTYYYTVKVPKITHGSTSGYVYIPCGNLLVNQGGPFYINYAVSPNTTIYSGTTTRPSNLKLGSSGTAGNFYIELKSYGKVCTEMVYPSDNALIVTSQLRKAIFHTYMLEGTGQLSDIEVSFTYNGGNYSYSYLNNSNLFELRTYSNEVSSQFTGDLDYNGFYGVFKFPQQITSNVTNFEITARVVDSRVTTISSSAVRYTYGSISTVSVNEIVLKSQCRDLFNVLNQINTSYSEASNEFDVNTMSTLVLEDVVQSEQFRKQFIYFKSLYNKLSQIFPNSYVTNTTLNNMYLPEEDGNELIEANTNTPTSNVNGNFFNNLIWIVKNLL